MRISTRRVYVVECPSCRKPIDWTGEGGAWFMTKKDAMKQVSLWRGCEPNRSLTEWCGCRERKFRKFREAKKGRTVEVEITAREKGMPRK